MRPLNDHLPYFRSFCVSWVRPVCLYPSASFLILRPASFLWRWHIRATASEPVCSAQCPRPLSAAGSDCLLTCDDRQDHAVGVSGSSGIRHAGGRGAPTADGYCRHRARRLQFWPAARDVARAVMHRLLTPARPVIGLNRRVVCPSRVAEGRRHPDQPGAGVNLAGRYAGGDLQRPSLMRQDAEAVRQVTAFDRCCVRRPDPSLAPVDPPGSQEEDSCDDYACSPGHSARQCCYIHSFFLSSTRLCGKLVFPTNLVGVSLCHFLNKEFLLLCCFFLVSLYIYTTTTTTTTIEKEVSKCHT